MDNFKQSLAGLLPALVLALGLALAAPWALAAGPAGAAPAVEVVNVNTASADDLARVLDGVGLSRAAAIVAFREEHGAFTDLGDLVLVRGIGAATLQRNRPRLRLAD